MSNLDPGPYPADTGYDRAEALDAADPLRSFADEFSPVETGLIYLDGNSLGRLPRSTSARLAEVLEHEWGNRLIRSWPERWWDQADRLGDAIAELGVEDPKMMGRVMGYIMKSGRELDGGLVNRLVREELGA